MQGGLSSFKPDSDKFGRVSDASNEAISCLLPSKGDPSTTSRVAAVGDGESLPCLYKNNCDRKRRNPAENDPEEVDDKTVDRDLAYIRKAAFSLAQNVSQFVKEHGKDNVGFFTITFDSSVRSYQESQRRFHNFARRVLSELFGDRIKVLEPHRDGRPHYHLLVDCKGDIRSGFNWEHYKATSEHYKGGGTRSNAPKGDLGRTELLKRLHKALNSAGPKYGVGRMELTPIKSEGEAIGRYVGGYIAKGAINRDKRYKGSRWVSYSRNFTRAVKGAFGWVESGAVWRKKVALFAARHGCASFEQLKGVFGDRWAYHHREAIERMTIPEVAPSIDFAPLSQGSVSKSYSLRSVFPGIEKRHSKIGAGYARQAEDRAANQAWEEAKAGNRGAMACQPARTGIGGSIASEGERSWIQGDLIPIPSGDGNRVLPPSNGSERNEWGQGVPPRAKDEKRILRL